MKLVILDGYTENPGDLSWGWLSSLVEDYEIYDITPPELIVPRSIDADILVTNKTVLTAETIASLPKLRYISTLSTGYNTIDLTETAKRGITVSNIPAYSTDGVAQLVFALLLEITNQVGVHNESVKNGEWCQSEHFCYWKTPLTELAGKTMGIVGFGKIGSAVASIANAFGMKVIAFSPNTRTYNGFGKTEFLSLEQVAKESDVLSLHCPLTADTENLVNMDFLKKMKKNAIIINTSRGPVINEKDLREALDKGIIAAAGMDVLSTEPPKKDNPLLDCDKCFITPHIAWASLEARTRLMNIFRDNIKGFVTGNPVNVVGK